MNSPIAVLLSALFSSSVCLAAGHSRAIRLPALRIPLSETAELIEASGRSIMLPPGKPARDLGEVFQNTLSLKAGPNPPSSAAPLSVSVRGMDPIQTRYLVDGISWSEFQDGTAPVHLIPLQALERIDVYAEGPPVHSAEDGLGGALDFRIWRPDLRVSSGAQMRVGSYASTQVSAHTAQRKYGVFVSAERSNDNFTYLDDAGTAYNTMDDTIQTNDGGPSLAISALPSFTLWRGTSSSADLFTLHAHREAGVFRVARTGQKARVFEDLHLGVAHADFKSRALMLRSSAFGMHHSMSTDGQTVGLARIKRAQSLRLGVLSGARLELSSRVDVDASIGARGDYYSARDVVGRTLEHRQVTVPIATSIGWKTGSWVVTPASLLYVTDSSGRDRNSELVRMADTAFSPRLGVEYSDNRHLRFGVSVGRFFRIPSALERFGGPQGIEPSPSLRRESALRASISAQRGSAYGVSVRTSVSASEARDLIAFIPTSQASVGARNIARSRIYSSDTDLSYRYRSVEFRSGLAWMKTVNLSKTSWVYGRELPLRPTWRGFGGVSWGIDRVKLSYRYDWTGRRFLDVSNASSIASYGEHSASLGWQSKQWGDLLLEVRNITDTTNVASEFGNLHAIDYTTGISGYPAAGRRLYLSWSVDL